MELTSRLHAFLWTLSGANNCNTYLIRSEKNILIDPGHAAHFDHVRRQLKDLELTEQDIDLIICTHAHPDHMEAVTLFQDTPALFAIHAAEWRLVREMAAYLRTAMDVEPQRFEPDFFLEEGDLTLGDIRLKVYHTPGHAPGAVTLLWPESRVLFTGDLIFKDGLGRTDLPGGDSEDLKQSIRRMASMDVAWLLPGHGDVISGAASVKANFEQVERMWFAYL